ncbi:glutathione S-transferase [Alcanivorax hongdengensis A-11-3]|uniref:glutathione transferase n=1 Tax=Alcanivorax hongdengensis A-11-3 TaxID=1177179 RepID=L0WG24_9GAMM|nr:glutathione S-transferase [Alcanivorax hongdengensis]EKF75798.1 glutathione S-transferase [Alcanivorax hongdengensis A-11-3]
MITVHHLENSRSQRILWLLEELALDYDIQHYARDRKTMLAPPSLRKIHPLGKSPVITDGDTVIAESGTITEYLIQTYGNGQWQPGAADPQWLNYRYWLHYAEGSLMPLLVMKLIFGHIPKSPMPFFARPVARAISGKVTATLLDPQITTHLAVINDHLGEHTWFAGEQPSGADIQMSFPLQAAAARADLSALPHIRRFLDQVQQRPAYQRAVDKGGELQVLGG